MFTRQSLHYTDLTILYSLCSNQNTHGSIYFTYIGTISCSCRDRHFYYFHNSESTFSSFRYDFRNNYTYGGINTQQCCCFFSSNTNHSENRVYRVAQNNYCNLTYLSYLFAIAMFVLIPPGMQDKHRYGARNGQGLHCDSNEQSTKSN